MEMRTISRRRMRAEKRKKNEINKEQQRWKQCRGWGVGAWGRDRARKKSNLWQLKCQYEFFHLSLCPLLLLEFGFSAIVGIWRAQGDDVYK